MVAGVAATTGEASGVRLGVRIDARPFVFAREDGSYGGFLYDLCRSALAHAGVAAGAIELVPVEAGTRFDRMDDAEAPLDLLCDPTTITMERASRWDFTQIVFFAHSVTLARKRPVILPSTEAPPACDTGSAQRVVLVGWVESTTSDPTVAEMTAQVPEARGDVAVCPVAFARHDEGVRAICLRDGRLSFYVGDADILSAQVEAMRREGPPCPVAFNARNAQPEPYALIVGDRIPDLRRRITSGIYAFFRSGEAERAFQASFGGREKAPTLQTLFTLYRLP